MKAVFTKVIRYLSHFVLVGTAILLLVLNVSSKASAQVSMDPLPEDRVFGDFVVGPGKMEIALNPGQSQTVILTVANRLGTDKIFTVSLEDFTGSTDPSKTVVLLGDDRGPYSLKNYLTPATTSIKVPANFKARIPVTISVPANAEPGGLYGSVIIGTVSSASDAAVAGGAAGISPIVTRIGTLFFVRVNGDAKQSGYLQEFSIAGNKKIIWNNEPITFNLLFKNDGNVHVNPYGTISVSNMLGTTIGSIEAEPWFAMPQSLRFRQISFAPKFLFGKYTAHAAINPGYAAAVNEAEISFWVIPWKIFVGVLLGLFVIIFGLRIIVKKFKISRR